MLFQARLFRIFQRVLTAPIAKVKQFQVSFRRPIRSLGGSHPRSLKPHEKNKVPPFGLTLFGQKLAEKFLLFFWQELTTFARHVVRQFFEVAQENKTVFMELFFWKSVREAFEVKDGYGGTYAR